MKKYSFLLLISLTGSLVAMDVPVKKLKIADDVTIKLKDGEKAISPDIVDRFKEVIGIQKIVEHDIETHKSLDLSYINKDQFDLVLESIEAIEAGKIEDFLIALNKKKRNQLVTLIDAANFLEINAIMNLFKETLGDNIKTSIESKPDLVKALLIPKFIKLYQIDLDKRDYGSTALIREAKWGHKDMVNLLIEAGAEVNAQNDKDETALMFAVDSNHKDIVELLIEAGADLEVKNEKGKTALILAASGSLKYDRSAIVKLLIEAGADLNAQDQEGETPLMTAVFYGYGAPKVVKLLIEAGANLEIKDKKGDTALLKSKNDEIIRMLVKAGANVNAQGSYGWTILMQVARWNYTSEAVATVKALVEAGADINLKNSRGLTALELAKEVRTKEVAELLARYA